MAITVVMARGCQRLPIGLINNHWVMTIAKLVYDINQPTCDEVNSHFCTK